MNLDLTEEMIDAVLIKVKGAYDDPGESSTSDMDEDSDIQVISTSDSSESSEPDCQTSNDSSPVKVPEKCVSFNINEIKLRKSEVRLTPIDASFFQLKKTVNSGSVQRDATSDNISSSCEETLKTNGTVEKLSEVNANSIRNPLKSNKSPEKLSQKCSVVEKVSQEAHKTNDNSENPSKINRTVKKICEINKNVEAVSAPEETAETASKVNNILKVSKKHCVVFRKNAPKIIENLQETPAVDETVEKAAKADETARNEAKVSKVVEKLEDSGKSVTVCSDLQYRDIKSINAKNSKIDEKSFKHCVSPLMHKDLITSIADDFKPPTEIKPTLSSSKTEKVTNNVKPEIKTAETIESKNEFVEGKSSSEFFDDDNVDDESDHDGLCIDWKMDNVKDTDSSSKKDTTVSLNSDVKNVNSGVTEVISTSHSNDLDSASLWKKFSETQSVPSDSIIRDLDNFETAAKNQDMNCNENLLESTKEQKPETKSTSMITTSENKLTLYGESDVSSVVTVKLVCESCAQFVKKEIDSGKSSSISYIIVKDKDCEICKNKDQSLSPMKISTEGETSPSVSIKAPTDSVPLSNVEKTIESVARNFSKDTTNSESCTSKTPVKISCESVLKEILQTAGCTNKLESALTSSSQDNVIVLKSTTNPTSNKSVFTEKNHIIIKDAVAIANASKNLKASGTATLDGKLYKVIFLPKTSSGKTSITTSASSMKNAGENIIKKLDPITVKVASSENSASAVTSTTSLTSGSFSVAAVNKLISSNPPCILTPAEPTSVSSNSSLKKIIPTPILSSSTGVPTVPNRYVFSSAKSTSLLSSVSSSQLLRKKSPLLSIIKSDGSKFKATDKNSVEKNIIDKKMSIDSSGATSLSPEKSKFIALHDYLSHKPVSSYTVSVSRAVSSPFLPPKACIMKSLEPDRNSSLKVTQSVLINNPSSLISLKNGISRNGFVVNDEGAIPMSTTVCPKRPRFSYLESEKVPASYLSNFLDEDSKKSILNSTLLPPFTPTVPDSIYDANNPVAKFSCAQCPDTFTSADHLQNHLNRRSVLLKYNCPLCLNKLVIVYNRCMLKQHCEKHNMPVILKHLTIEPLPLTLFDLNLFSSIPGEPSDISAINISTVASSINNSNPNATSKKPRKSRAKSKKSKPNPEESNSMLENSSLLTSTASAPSNSTSVAIKTTESYSAGDGNAITPCSASPKKIAQDKPAAEKKLDTLTYCEECQTTFSSLSVHLQDSGKPNAAYTCECKKVCPSLCSLKAHMRLHGKKPPHSCPECGASFLFASALDDHFKKSCYHPFKKNSYQCLKCNQNFSVVQKLEWHVLRNHTRQLNICGTCEFSSPDSAVVSDHMSQNHAEQINHASYRILRFMECDFCPKTKFPRHQNRQHIQTHTKQKSTFTPNYYYQCDYCSVYKTLNKVDFGQHLDYCLFSTSLRSLEEHSQEDDFSLSDTEKPDKSTLDSKISVKTELSCCDNKAPVTNDVEKTVDDCKSTESVGTESSSSASDETQKVKNFESSPDANNTLQNLKQIKINQGDHTPESLESSDQMESAVKKRSVWQCKYCPEQFLNSKKVYTHLKSQHSDVISAGRLALKRKKAPSSSQKSKVMKNTDVNQRPDSMENSSHECSKCNFVGVTYADLFNHMETHKTIYECQECSDSFVARPSLEKHMIVTHQCDMKKAKSIVESNSSCLEVVKENGAYLAKQGFYQCATCYKNFTSEESFSVHFRTHGLAFVTDSASPTTLIK